MKLKTVTFASNEGTMLSIYFQRGYCYHLHVDFKLRKHLLKKVYHHLLSKQQKIKGFLSTTLYAISIVTEADSTT